MDHSFYYELGSGDDARLPTAHFVLNSLLRSRVECGFESDEEEQGEAVNVYLVHLLSKLVSAPSLGPVAAERDLDVFEQVRESNDPRFKSMVYRVNADHLLLTTSLFCDTPFQAQNGERHYVRSARQRIGRGKAYYHYASLFHERLPVSPVVSRVLQLLSEDFERYVDVLFHMRSEYFHLFERLKEDDIMSLQEELFSTPDGSIVGLGSLRDDFLDAYWTWRHQPDATSQAALEAAAARLKAVDPKFGFELPQ
ncbi:MAG: hypothetical protein DHS20C21_10150 [Gemmatimonadota bacterium]|nr:MAG: hypothetical protein DHS20C21_10150 [Gemmatimonadota bacterium]